MLLQRLNEYADRLELPPPGYSRRPIRWIIDLDASGKFLGFVKTETSGGRGDRGKEMLPPDVLKTSGVRAKLLADNGEYVLGIARDSTKQGLVNTRHAAFVETIRAASLATGEASVKAVLYFLENLDVPGLQLPADLDPRDSLTFRVAGTFPVDLPSVCEFWGSYTETLASGERKTMQCIICGDMKQVMDRLPVKVKGIPGGQRAGMALISANEPAFESYGLSASQVAPTCRDCGERFGHALNRLIGGESTHLVVGPLVYVFWARTPGGFTPALILQEPGVYGSALEKFLKGAPIPEPPPDADPEKVKELLNGPWKGREYTAMDDDAFYATALSASGGRVVIRSYLEATVWEVRRNLRRWFSRQRIVNANGTWAKPIGLFRLAASLYRDAKREIQPNVPEVLVRAALQGSPLPDSLLFQAVRRTRVSGRTKKERKEPKITQERAALIKMLLVADRHMSEKEEAMEQLDVSNRDPAYLCGRLLAEIEAVQRAAIPGVRATVIDRYFGTASSAPATVFGHLLRGAQNHLAKLRRDNPGASIALQRRMEEILEGLQEFPRALTLKEQALFSLGYYHQRAEDRGSGRARK